MTDACASCRKTPPEATLKRCSKCQTTQYCSRECQKTNWKQHKKICDSQAATQQDRDDIPSPPKGCEAPITQPFARLRKGTYLHDRPEKDVYKLLIDAYRLRVEDEFAATGEADEDSIYSGLVEDGLEGLERFLDDAEYVRGLLPSWWGPQKRQACGAYGLGGDAFSDLAKPVTKSDIVRHYGDPQFHLQLRRLAETICGDGPVGQNGFDMRQMLELKERSGQEGPVMRLRWR
jgi:splicing suppressor protein 51